MAEGRIKSTELSAIAAAIRQKNGTNTTYKPSQMAAAIQALPGAPTLQSLSVNANGSYTPGTGVDGYSSVSVNVPNSYAAGDEGKVVSNGALVAQAARSSEITANGTYDTTLNNSVVVAVNVQNSGVLLSGTMIDTHDSSQLDGKSIIPLGYCSKVLNYTNRPPFDGPDISTEQNSGQNYKCVHVGSQGAAQVIFLQQIPSSATRLYISAFAKFMSIADQGSGCNVNLFDSGVFGGMSTAFDATHRIKGLRLCYGGMTAEQINNQSGVEILVNSNDECPYQTVEVDISNISVDTFLGIYVSGADTYIREISYS